MDQITKNPMISTNCRTFYHEPTSLRKPQNMGFVSSGVSLPATMASAFLPWLVMGIATYSVS